MADGVAGSGMMTHSTTALREELDHLLGEETASAQQRARTAFDSVAAPFARSIVLFGAGNLGRKALRGLRQLGIEPLGFADNNPALWGTSIEGTPIFAPIDAAERFGRIATVVMTIWRGEGTDTMAERCQPLTDLGFTRVVNFGALFWKYPETFLPHYSFDLPERVLEQRDAVRRAFDLWEDDASRREFVAQIRWRLRLDFDGLPRPVEHEIYFPDDLVRVGPDEVFVDCGAFDGDTMERFLERHRDAFARYIALEADPANFERLRRNVAALPAGLRERLAVRAVAVGARHEKVRFASTGTESSAVGHGDLEIDSAPLDDIVGASEPTWIKMDIEGSELDALHGARQIVRSRTPVLAVCVYHQQDHVWRIPLAIRELSDEYRFFLRPHLLESWDLVCYAVPRARLDAAEQPLA
jgi:FkbM family methyltransferase